MDGNLRESVTSGSAIAEDAMAKWTYSETEVRRIKKQVESKTINNLTNGIFEIYTLALTDLFNFSNKDLTRLWDRVEGIIEGLDTGEISPGDVKKVLKDELEIEFKF